MFLMFRRGRFLHTIFQLVFIVDILIERTRLALLTTLTYLLHFMWHSSAWGSSANLFLVIIDLQWKFCYLYRIFSTVFQKCSYAFRNKATRLAIDKTIIKSAIKDNIFLSSMQHYMLCCLLIFY